MFQSSVNELVDIREILDELCARVTTYIRIILHNCDGLNDGGVVAS